MTVIDFKIRTHCGMPVADALPADVLPEPDAGVKAIGSNDPLFVDGLRELWQLLFRVAYHGELPADQRRELARAMARLAYTRKGTMAALDNVRIGLHHRQLARTLPQARRELDNARLRIARIRDGKITAVGLVDAQNDVARLATTCERAQVALYAWHSFLNEHAGTFNGEAIASEVEGTCDNAQ